MIIDGELEVPRYRVDSYTPTVAKTHYYGDDLEEAKYIANYTFKRFVSSGYQYKSKIVIFDNLEDKEVQVRYYPDEMV